MLRDLRDKPPINFLWRNVLWNCGATFTGTPGCADLREIEVCQGEDPGFADPDRGDFRLQPDSPLVSRDGFRPIPVDEIGLYDDNHRATWPVASEPMDVPDWRTKA